MSGTFKTRLMSLKFSHLSYFVTIAEEGSFQGAATRLHLSQPTLSRQIRELENQVESELFMRGKSGSSLTPAGEALLIRARSILEAREALFRSMLSFQQQELRLGYLATSLFGPVGDGVAQLRRFYPEAAIRVIEASPGRQIEMLGQGELQIAFLGHFEAEVGPDIHLHTLYSVPLVAVLPVAHRLTERNLLRLEELSQESFLGLQEELFPGRQALLADLCRRAGFAVEFRHLADSLLSLFSLVAHGQGISLVPAGAAALGFSQITFLPISNPQAEVSFMAATRRGEKSLLVEKVLEFCRECGNRLEPAAAARLPEATVGSHH